MMKYTFNRNYVAWSASRDGVLVIIPDQVYDDQKIFDGRTFPARLESGAACRVRLRGDLYGLHTSGTGDPVVAIVSNTQRSGSTKKTINLVGIGFVEIDTELKSIQLCSGLTADGFPANCRTRKVGRSVRNAEKAKANFAYTVAPVPNFSGFFIVL